MRIEGQQWEFPREPIHVRPLGDLVRDLARETQALVRDELRLARAELRDDVGRTRKGGTRLGAGGAVLYVALILLGVTLVLVGATFLAAWLSALIVTVLYAVVGWVLFASGRRELERAGPSRALGHIKEDGRWVKETMQAVRSRRGATASPAWPARSRDD